MAEQKEKGERRGEWYKKQEGGGGRRVAHIRLTPIYFVSALIELTPSASQSPLLQLPSPRPRRVFAAFPRVSYFTFSEWPSKAQKGNAKSAHSEDIHTLTHTLTLSLSLSLTHTAAHSLKKGNISKTHTHTHTRIKISSYEMQMKCN